MFVEISKRQRLVEVWATDLDDFTGFKEPFPEETYQHLNQWCIDTFGYHARSAFNQFKFKKEKDLTMFLLRWN